MQPSEQRTRRYAISAALFAATVAVYSRVVGHEFVNYDDLIVIVQNPNLASPPTPANLLRHFWTPFDGNWLPLTWITLHFDRWLYELDATPFLITNVVLHAAATVALFAALERMTGADGRSAFVAAVFALHPLHVESVAWATERKDVLAALFWMLGLYAWALYVETPRSRLRRAAVALCLVLGLLSKSTLVTFPFVLLLLDHWPLDRLRGALRERLVEKIPLFAIVLAASAVTVAIQSAAGQTQLGASLGPAARLVNAAWAYWLYLGDAIWPSGLAVLYPHPFALNPPDAKDIWIGAGLGLALLVLSAWALREAGRRPYLFVGWFWYLGTLVPMIGLVHVGLQARADRYMYIPLVGLAIATSWGIGEAVSRSRPLQRATAIAACVVLAALALTTWGQLAHWQDTLALWGRAAAVTENNRFANEHLANALGGAGRDAEAIAHFEEALRIEPDRTRSVFALAFLQRRVGDRDAAIASYERGLALQPGKVRAHGELGCLLVEAGRHDDALPHLEIALARLPDDAEFRAAREIAIGRAATAE